MNGERKTENEKRRTGNRKFFVLRSPFSVLLLVAVFCSCSTDVELYADYKEIPVVYGIIDAQADTNFLKITRAFCGTNDNPVNAFEAAQVYDSSNYPGKLDAFFVELQNVQGQGFQPTGRTFYLDTLTVHNKEEGLFYAPHQILYYTTERFKTTNYRYRLHVVTPNYDTVTSEICVVNGDINVALGQVSFQSAPTHAHSTMLFCSTEEGVLYQLGMRFNYLESHGGSPVKKQVSWSYDPRPLSEYEKVEGTDNFYYLYYSPNILFNVLERVIGNDTVWDDNHPNVIRYIDDFEVFIAAAGSDFFAFYQFLQTSQNGLSLSSEYNNIEGGYGLLSSRIFVSKVVPFSPSTKLDLFNQPWGFRER